MWLRTVSTLIPISSAICAVEHPTQHLSLAGRQVVVARRRLPAAVLDLGEAEDALDDSVRAVDADRADLDGHA